MADDITNRMLLEHIQAMKNDLQQQISGIDARVNGLQEEVASLRGEFVSLRGEMRFGFEEARLHRQALQEDLDATIRMQSKHDAKLARL